jgi:ESS family glutamate:Na+ symporter
MVTLDLINTVAFGGVVLFFGHGIRRFIPALSRYNVPAPVIGGLLVALMMLAARSRGAGLMTFDTRLQAPFMIAFFTTVGFGASVSLLKVGGPQVVLFLLLATVLAVAQNVIGIIIAIPMGMHPLFGVLNGSVTLTGGPATGLAFAPAFEQAGVPALPPSPSRRRWSGLSRAGSSAGRRDDPHRALRPAPRARFITSADCGADRRGSAARGAGDGAARRGQGVARAAQGAGRDPRRDVGGIGGQRVISSTGVTLPAYIGAMLWQRSSATSTMRPG